MSESILDEDLDMATRRTFERFTSSATNGCTARLGRLAFPGRKPIDTPNYNGVTSRGSIPHLTPDNLSQHTSFGGTYMALEDCMYLFFFFFFLHGAVLTSHADLNQKKPAIYEVPPGNKRPLHIFTALPSDQTTILAPRRCPAVVTPVGNSAQAMSIFTSTGFYNLSGPQYADAVAKLQPDVVVPMADLPHLSTMPVVKKQIRMVERTEEWLDEFFRLLPHEERLEPMGVSVFAPVLPLEHPIQWAYLTHLADDLIDSISGLAIYDVNILPELTEYASLAGLPKLSIHIPESPHQVLRQISLGIDLCTIPFVNASSDAGVAFSFTFPPPDVDSPQPLGMDMYAPENSTSTAPFFEGCQCYACTKHHKAFLHHLLNAKEMLGWSLLQIHNHQVLTEFFVGIRETLKKGLDEFEKARQRFRAAYEPELPEGTGVRPRARGYHFKALPGDKMNKPQWTWLNEADPTAGEGDTMMVDSDAAEVTLTPDVDGPALAAKGVAQQQNGSN